MSGRQRDPALKLRCVEIQGKRTSIRMEGIFWATVDLMAAERGTTFEPFCRDLLRGQRRPGNLTRHLRVAAHQYLAERAEVPVLNEVLDRIAASHPDDVDVAGHLEPKLGVDAPAPPDGAPRRSRRQIRRLLTAASALEQAADSVRKRTARLEASSRPERRRKS